jgi:RHS repeat-associated protein
VRVAGNLPTDHTFTGQVEDDSTGLHFYNARYYSNVLGRFISADSIVPGAGNPQAFNRYSYSYNNPLNYIDPSGHSAVCATMPDECESQEGDPDPVTPTQADPQASSDDWPYGGEEVKALYEQMKACISCWWYADGDFTLEKFLGLMIMHEAAGAASSANWIAKAIAQQLYVGGNPPAYCPSGLCVNGVFNFLAAYSESVHNLVDRFVRGTGPITKYFGYGQFARKSNETSNERTVRIKAKLTEATQWGNQALHPSVLNPSRYYAPTDWGNFDSVNRALTADNAQIGPNRNQILYRLGPFYVQTTLQNNYWNERADQLSNNP